MPRGSQRRGRRRAARRQEKHRLLVLLLLATAGFAGITGRLVAVQVLDAPSLDHAAARQRLRTIELPAERGRVYDRDYETLALSVDAATIYADPRLVTDPRGTASRLAPLLRQPVAELERKLTADRAFVYLARQVRPNVGQAVSKLDLPGVGVLDDTLRDYPSGPLAAQVLGVVGVDGKGLAGVEYQYDTLLRGRAGKLLVEQDPGGRAIPQGRRSVERPQPGSDLVLTIDRDVQYVAEQALARAVRQWKARGGSVVVLAPATGEVLAIANAPTFDPNRYRQGVREEAWRNRAISSVYEPGSTSKTITAAAALEAGVVQPGSQLTVPDSYELCPGVKTFHDAHEHEPEVMTFSEVVAESSNVGTIQVAQRLGAERLAAAERAFGLGQRTGIELPGESPGLVNPVERWTCPDLGTNAIGQGVGVTLLQMASAYAAVANGGVLVPPRIVRGTVDSQGKLRPAASPQPRRVISAGTARALTTMLTGVVAEGGTGTQAALPNYSVAGKTGTAQKPDPEGGGYLPGAFVASFIGFAPAERPAVVVAVALDEPRPAYYGGTVAAPVFREVASFALMNLGVIPPDKER